MTNPKSPAEPESQKQETLVTHLVELRSRMVRAIFAVLVVFLALFPFANKIYTYLAGPLTRHMPEGSSMVAIDVASPFLTPFKLALMLSIVISIPVILYQIWAFVAPGLYKHERKMVLPLVFSSSALFFLGMAFAYFVVFPLMFSFFTSAAPEGVAVMTDIGRYLDFVIKIFLAFGIAFEVPIVTLLVINMGIADVKSLKKKRPYVIVAAFVIGMILTPPDIISQTLLAVPVWLLFELGLFMSRFITKADHSRPASS